MELCTQLGKYEQYSDEHRTITKKVLHLRAVIYMHPCTGLHTYCSTRRILHKVFKLDVNSHLTCSYRKRRYLLNALHLGDIYCKCRRWHQCRRSEGTDTRAVPSESCAVNTCAGVTSLWLWPVTKPESVDPEWRRDSASLEGFIFSQVLHNVLVCGAY